MIWQKGNWRTSSVFLSKIKWPDIFTSFLHIAREFATSSSSWCSYFILPRSHGPHKTFNFSFLLFNEGLHSFNYSKELRYRYKGWKIEMINFNTRGIEIVWHAATSTIHKLEGSREDRGKVKMYSFKIENSFYGNLQPLLFLVFHPIIQPLKLQTAFSYKTNNIRYFFFQNLFMTYDIILSFIQRYFNWYSMSLTQRYSMMIHNQWNIQWMLSIYQIKRI